MSEFVSFEFIGIYEPEDFCTNVVPYGGRYLCDCCGECEMEEYYG